DGDRCEPERNRRQVEYDGDKYVGDDEQQRGDQYVEDDMGRKVSVWVLVTLERHVGPIEVPSELVQLGHEGVDFQQHRTDHAEVARAMFARDRLILDGFGAERAFHRLTGLPSVYDLCNFGLSAP